MGLLCFGLIACLRGFAALVPSLACRLPVQKFAAVAGVTTGLGYVLLSGLSISAIRAFLMAILVLAAWLIDRLGLTVGNVGLAAGVILLVSPLVLFLAEFQLSFAATAALVIWFESWRPSSAIRRRWCRQGQTLSHRPDHGLTSRKRGNAPTDSLSFRRDRAPGCRGQSARHSADRAVDHAGGACRPDHLRATGAGIPAKAGNAGYAGRHRRAGDGCRLVLPRCQHHQCPLGRHHRYC